MFAPFVPKVRMIKRNSIVGQIVVVLLGIQLFFLASFSGFSLPTATANNLLRYFHNLSIHELRVLPNRYQEQLKQTFPDLNLPAKQVRFTAYVPQVPVAVFAGYILGAFLAPIAAISFLVLGSIGPVVGIHLFGCGGESNYYMHPSFGYLIGMVVASWSSGWFTRNERNSLTQLLAMVSALAAVHLIGVTYLFGCSAVVSITSVNQHALDWQQWVLEEVRNMTWYQLPYDIVFSMIVIGLGFPFRWLVNILIAPDIAFKSKPQTQFQEMLASSNSVPELSGHELG